MLLEVDFPPDNRVEKEAISLIEAGHKVDMACYTFLGKASKEQYKGITLFRKSISKFLFKSSAASLVLPFYFNFWKKFILQILRENTYDAIHVHDLPLTRVAYTLCKEYSMKLICDQHEYYSNWIVHTAHLQKGLGPVIRFFSNWKRYEKKYLSKADLVLTVEEPLREAYIKNDCVSEETIILVPNTPLKEVFNSANVRKEIIGRYEGQYLLFYAGGLDKLRGLDMVIKALPEIRKKIPNIKLVLGGRLSKGFDLFGLAEELKVTDLIEHHSWIESSDLPSYLSIAKMGFFTPPGNRDEIHNTIATKIYQYLAMDVPVIVSDVRLMKQFVLDHGIGMVANTDLEFADLIIDHFEHPEKREKLINNCKKYNSAYTWEKSVQQLLERYAKL